MTDQSHNSCLADLPMGIRCRFQHLPTFQEGQTRLRLRQEQRQLAFGLANELIGSVGERLHSNALERVIWPKELVGSISHSGGVVLAAVAQLSDVTHLGVDCEMVLHRARADRLARRILCDKDLLEWPKSGLSWEEFVTLCFCLKEAAYKSLTPEIQKPLGFRSFSVKFDKKPLSPNVWIQVTGTQFREPLGLEGQYGIFGKAMLCIVWRGRLGRGRKDI